LAANFIALHELAHLTQGFIKYRAKHPWMSNLARQSFEVHADNEAVWHSLCYLKSIIENAERQPPPFNQFCKDPEQAFRAWLFAFFCFGGLFGDQTVRVAKIANDDSPPFRFRQRLIIDVVAGLAQSEPFSGVFGDNGTVAYSINRTLSE